MKVKKDNRYLYIKGLKKEITTVDMFDLLRKDNIQFRLSVMMKALEGLVKTEDIIDFFHRARDYYELDESKNEETIFNLVHNLGWFRTIYERGSMLKRGRRLSLDDINRIIDSGSPMFVATATTKDIDEQVIRRRNRSLDRAISDFMDNAPHGWHYGTIRIFEPHSMVMVVWSDFSNDYIKLESELVDMAAEARIERTLMIRDCKSFLTTWEDNRITSVEVVPHTDNEIADYLKYVAKIEIEDPESISIAERYSITRVEAYNSDPLAKETFQHILERHGFDDYMDSEHIEDINWRELLPLAIGYEQII